MGICEKIDNEKVNENNQKKENSSSGTYQTLRIIQIATFIKIHLLITKIPVFKIMFNQI